MTETIYDLKNRRKFKREGKNIYIKSLFPEVKSGYGNLYKKLLT